MPVIINHWGGLGSANVHTAGASGMELAAGRRIGRGRDTAFQDDAVHFDGRVGNRYRAEQSFGVGMQRVREDFLLRAVLD